MAREQTQGRIAPLSLMPMMYPMQQFGCMVVDSVKQITDFQIGMARSYTHYALGQLRDALEVHDPQSLRRFLEKQTDATEELTRRISEDTERAMHVGQEMSRRGIQLVQRGGDIAASNLKQGTEQARELSEQGERVGREIQQQFQRAQERRPDGGSSRLAIDNYDELSVEDIEQRLDKLNPEQIRQLSDHERKNKNRKTLNEAFQRRL